MMNNGIVIGKLISIEFECFAVVEFEVGWGGGGVFNILKPTTVEQEPEIVNRLSLGINHHHYFKLF